MGREAHARFNRIKHDGHNTRPQLFWQLPEEFKNFFADVFQLLDFVFVRCEEDVCGNKKHAIEYDYSIDEIFYKY